MKIESVLKYYPQEFDIIKLNSSFVKCSVTGKHIPLEHLVYWNVERQEPYADALASNKREKELNYGKD